MRKLIVNEFMSLDGVAQAPGGDDEDPTGGFAHGGWHMKYMDDGPAQKWVLESIVEAGGFIRSEGRHFDKSWGCGAGGSWLDQRGTRLAEGTFSLWRQPISGEPHMNREDTQAKTVGKKAESVTAQAENAASEAADAVREVTDNFGKALGNSLERQPMTTIAMAVAVGFVLGALWKT